MSKRFLAPALAGLVTIGASTAAMAQQATAPARPAERIQQNAEQRIEQRRENVERRRENIEGRRENAAERRDAAVVAGHKIENMDQFMTAWLAPANEEEIILAKMAQERATNAQVKEFAGQMIQQHSQLLRDLEKFGRVEHVFNETAAVQTTAPRAVEPVDRDNPAPVEGAVREAIRGVNETTREVVADVGDAVRHAVGYTDAADACRMKNEIHKQCLALTKAELDKWQGHEFDQAYLGQQAGAHIAMLATLKAFEQYATDEMRPLIQQARATTEQHLNHANQLMRQLDRPTTARTGAVRTQE